MLLAGHWEELPEGTERLIVEVPKEVQMFYVNWSVDGLRSNFSAHHQTHIVETSTKILVPKYARYFRVNMYLRHSDGYMYWVWGNDGTRN